MSNLTAMLNNVNVKETEKNAEEKIKRTLNQQKKPSNKILVSAL